MAPKKQQHYDAKGTIDGGEAPGHRALHVSPLPSIMIRCRVRSVSRMNETAYSRRLLLFVPLLLEISRIGPPASRESGSEERSLQLGRPGEHFVESEKGSPGFASISGKYTKKKTPPKQPFGGVCLEGSRPGLVHVAHSAATRRHRGGFLLFRLLDNRRFRGQQQSCH